MNDKKPIILQGLPMSEGRVLGRVFHYRNILTAQMEVRELDSSEVKKEIKRLHSAIKAVQSELGEMKKNVEKDISSEHGAIFESHKSILDDSQIIDDLERDIKKRMLSSEQIVQDVFQRWVSRLKASENEKTQGIADDVRDVGKRLLAVLNGVEMNMLANLPKNSVVFAKRLLPSDTIHLNKKNAKALVVEEGGPTSHAAILSKAMGVPLVSRITQDQSKIPQHASVLVDGKSGEVIVNPEKKDIAGHRDLVQKTILPFLKSKIGNRHAANHLVFNGQKILVYANVSTPDEIKSAVKSRCDGIGLYRIEPIYMANNVLPTEDYLYRYFKKAIKGLGKKDIVLRLLDIGGDKKLPYLEVTGDDSSLMGIMGIRLLLRHKALIETQVNACLRLSEHYNVRLLIPMVSLPSEIREVRAIVQNQMAAFKKSNQKYNPDLKIGSMIETPAAVLSLDKILKESDFISIGTNDLIQYSMAADREKSSLSEYHEEGKKLIMTWVDEITSRCHKADVPVAMCGDLAGDLKFTRSLLSNGLRAFSVIPTAIPPLREKISEIIRDQDTDK